MNLGILMICFLYYVILGTPHKLSKLSKTFWNPMGNLQQPGSSLQSRGSTKRTEEKLVILLFIAFSLLDSLTFIFFFWALKPFWFINPIWIILQVKRAIADSMLMLCAVQRWNIFCIHSISSSQKPAMYISL